MPHGIYPTELAAMLVPKAGEKWRPSNGTEGEIFYDSWCANCIRETRRGCPIQLDTMLYDVIDEQYPGAWRYGTNGQPECSSFESREDRGHV